MIAFSFIKYVKGCWQFSLTPDVANATACCILIDANQISDHQYNTLSAQLADEAFAQWNNGVLLEASATERDYIKSLYPPTLQDEYRFIKKYWGSKWCLYIFLIRVLGLHNPLKEIRAFIYTLHVKKNVLGAKVIPYKQFDETDINKNDLVSIIIPTLNRYDYLKDTLQDLCHQTFTNFEVIVTDQSNQFDTTFYESFPLNIVLIRQEEKLLWTARNNAIKKSKGSLILFFDDDSRVAPDWIEMHIKAINYFNADVSAGVSLASAGAKIPADYNYLRWADQFDSGNAMVRRKVFEKTGLFDEQFNEGRQGDGEYGYRLYMHGCRSISNPKAYRVHLKADKGGLRESVGWDGWRPKYWWQPKPVPSVLYAYKKYFTKSSYRYTVFLNLLLSHSTYAMKRNAAIRYLSMVIFFISIPLTFIRYRKSERIAEEMFLKFQTGQEPVQHLMPRVIS